ncbi:divergent PAP2 family protein [Cyanobium sp. BA20m-14]|uniref:divergent PAP2 family protein n=1 Tax=Cyanobium sp. BA20m-14 TaxID=2823703 RepID=UPI0020CC2B75|nr:divergent PAP2 family protein [Cyanobium sp. BA20m-14]MCP9912438.1 divergent PAP2 family protein [Cyanobium sp. BA20m-14]
MSEPLLAILDNGVLWWGLAACGVAQLSKLVIELVVHRRWNPRVLVETGGMPSSHSALLTGTTAALGWVEGFGGPLFGLAAVLCFVVLYDASGVRRAAGLTAARVNAMVQVEIGELEIDSANPRQHEKPLKENLGHTRLEVLIGSLIGPLVALPGLVLAGSPLHLAQALGWLAPIG